MNLTQYFILFLIKFVYSELFVGFTLKDTETELKTKDYLIDYMNIEEATAASFYPENICISKLYNFTYVPVKHCYYELNNPYKLYNIHGKYPVSSIYNISSSLIEFKRTSHKITKISQDLENNIYEQKSYDFNLHYTLNNIIKIISNGIQSCYGRNIKYQFTFGKKSLIFFHKIGHDEYLSIPNEIKFNKTININPGYSAELIVTYITNHIKIQNYVINKITGYIYVIFEELYKDHNIWYFNVERLPISKDCRNSIETIETKIVTDVDISLIICDNKNNCKKESYINQI